jgi:putative integral membrane protein (TIGR02587 family)
VRGASGGLLFGVPLLFTMEVWWIGSHTTPAQALLLLALTFVPVFLLNRTAGFRTTQDVRLRDAVFDTIEAVALGLVLVTVVLVLLREVTPASSVPAAVGKIVYETLPFCIGVAVARHFLHGGRAEGAPGDRAKASSALSATAADLGATLIGAVFIALNIAPTDEIPMLAASQNAVSLLGIMAASLLASYAIVFAAGFGRQDARHAQIGILQHPVTETVVCYIVALASAALMLWVFQRHEMPLDLALDRVVVLGFPAAIGGAAGRLAI